MLSYWGCFFDTFSVLKIIYNFSLEHFKPVFMLWCLIKYKRELKTCCVDFCVRTLELINHILIYCLSYSFLLFYTGGIQLRFEQSYFESIQLSSQAEKQLEIYLRYLCVNATQSAFLCFKSIFCRIGIWALPKCWWSPLNTVPERILKLLRLLCNPSCVDVV